MRIERASNKYPDLSWEVTLGPNQYFIIGARIEREHVGIIAAQIRYCLRLAVLRHVRTQPDLRLFKLRAILLGRKVVMSPQVALDGFEFLSILKTGDVIGGHRLPHRNSRFLFRRLRFLFDDVGRARQ